MRKAFSFLMLVWVLAGATPASLPPTGKRLPKVGILPTAPSELFTAQIGAKVFTDGDAAIVSIAPQIARLNGVRISSRDPRVELDSRAPVQLLVGIFRGDSADLAKPPATSPAIENAAVISGMPPLDLYPIAYDKGKRVLPLHGTYVILGIIPAGVTITPTTPKAGRQNEFPKTKNLFVRLRALGLFVLRHPPRGPCTGSPRHRPRNHEALHRHLQYPGTRAGRQSHPQRQSLGLDGRAIPFFDSPDPGLNEMYYFRWWSYRKHIKHIKASPYISLTEFLPWENPVSSAVGHHVMEGRWLHDNSYIDQDLLYWLRGNGPTGPGDGKPFDTHRFSSWTVWSAYQRYLVNNDKAFITGMLDDFIRDYREWE